MSTVSLTCPICDLDLSVATVDATEGPRNGTVGGHVHLAVSGAVSCLNNHRWVASGSFILTRSP